MTCDIIKLALPSCSQKTKRYHHFPAIDIRDAKTKKDKFECLETIGSYQIIEAC